MNKTLLLSLGILGWLVQSTSAQVSLFTTTDDFGQFNSGTVSSLYYSDSSTVNGLGNTVNPGGAGGIGSLQLTAGGGWGGLSDAPGEAGNQGFLSALDPGAVAGSSLASYSGTLSYDVYRGNLTDWNQFGVIFNYDNNWNSFFSSTTTDFTGADGTTWTHITIPYTINATSLSYFGFSVAENTGGGTSGETIYVDNFQVTSVPEPGTTAVLALGGVALLFFRRRSGR
jgi:hypothetical protein